MTETVPISPGREIHVARAPNRKSWSISHAASARLMNILSPLAMVAIWEFCARLGLIDVRFFPAPSSIFQVMLQLIESGELQANLFASLTRLFWGFLWGAIPALVLGITMGMFRPVRLIVEPIIAATYPIPKSAILPLILLIFGLGEASKVFMVGAGIFYPTLINTMAGVLEINKIHFDVGRNFGASGLQIFRTVAFPGALPLIVTGIKLGIGLGLVLICVAEMVGAKSGIGFMIWNAWEILSVETMYVGLITIAILGLSLTLILNEVERFIVPWKVIR